MILENEAFLQQVKGLLSAAQIVATTSYARVREHFPDLPEFPLDSWDFFVTVAALNAASCSLIRKAGPFDDLEALNSHLDREAEGYDVDIKRAIGDCGEFVNRTLEGASLDEEEAFLRELSDALGMWVLWNLYRRCPSHEESKPARAIGASVALAFHSWWDGAII